MDLSRELEKQGNKVTIMSGANDNKDFISETGITYVPFSFSMSNFPKGVFALRRFIKENGFDIVHCHHRSCCVFMQAVNCFYRIPYIWTNHADNIPSDLIHRLTTFTGKAVICVSSDLKNFCQNKLHIKESKLHVVLNGISCAQLQREPEWAREYRQAKGLENRKIVLLLARMAPIKDYHCLIEAVKKLSPDCRSKLFFVLTGEADGEYAQSVKREISEAGLGELFDLAGYITPGKALSLADFSVLPSKSEGFAISMIEGFYMKVPSLRTKTGGYSDMSEFCIGIDVGDFAALAHELEQLANGKDYSDIVQKAYRFVNEKCTVQAMAEKVMKVYREVLNK